ncbi:MAG: M20/M25/M40 family metallo-hydrolase [Pirellulaceae bacterium]
MPRVGFGLAALVLWCFSVLSAWSEERPASPTELPQSESPRLESTDSARISLSALVEKLSEERIKRHIDVLADDSFEGREAGSRGGRASGNYIEQLLAKSPLQPAGEQGTFFQEFRSGYRNILGILPGSEDPAAGPIVVLSAHYDHVGYGNVNNSFGPIGRIHNGADDNASGTAALLEIIEVLSQTGWRPRQTILFAFWDAEEKGLLGSKHWLEQPTLDIKRIGLCVNADMVGHLRNRRVEIYGTRTQQDLRQWVARANEGSDLQLDFLWEMKENSDHHPFFEKSIPALMIHTGLHDDYHRPGDDPHLINFPGTLTVTELLLSLTASASTGELRRSFRNRSRQELSLDRNRFEIPDKTPRSRLGIRLERMALPEGGIRVSGVAPDSPADRAGLKVGHVVTHFAGLPIERVEPFLAQVQAAPREVEITVAPKVGDDEAAGPRVVQVTLDLEPLPLGIGWKTDEAEPGSVVLDRVTPGSLAAMSGLVPLDRVYEVGGVVITNSDHFREMVTRFDAPIELLVERSGRLLDVEIDTAIIRPLLPEAAENEETVDSP